MVGDSKGYEELAENLLKYHSYALHVDTFHISNYSDYQLSGYITYHPDSFRMPLYSTVMAAIYFVAGINPYIVILMQILLSLCSVVLVYKMCMLLFAKMEVAKIATLLFALDIHSAYITNLLLTDTLAIFLLLMSTYLFLDGLVSKKIKLILLSGLCMGLGVLTRGIFLFYPSIIVLLVFAFSKQPLIWKFKALFLYLFAFGCLAVIWSVRNEVQYGHMQYSTQDGDELLMYNVAYTESRISNKSIDSVRVQLQRTANLHGFKYEKDLFKQSEIYTKLGVDYIRNHKAAYLKTHLLGAMNMYLSIGNVGMSNMIGWDNNKREERFAEVNTNRILENFTNNKKEALLGLILLLILAIQYFGAIAGLISLLKSKQYLFILLFLLTAAYFTAITGVVGNYRYKLPLVPFICIAAGYGYVYLKGKRTLPERTSL